MKKNTVCFGVLIFLLCCDHFPSLAQAAAGSSDLKVIFLRHAEKPLTGDNLSCQGLNRSLKLPEMITSRFGIPAYTYIPSMGLGDSTKHSRMFQTVIPLAVKYNLALNSKYGETDSTGVAADILKKKGLVLVVWEHKAIAPIARALGIRDPALKWHDDDYESIWIVGFKQGVAVLARETEGLKVSSDCTY